MDDCFNITQGHEGALEKPRGIYHCRVAAAVNCPEHRCGMEEQEGGDDSVESVMKGDDEDGVDQP